MLASRGFLKELRQDLGLYLLIFILVFLKKWEAGGHIDASWYSVIAKNISQTGNYFHFLINPLFKKEVIDHFPLSYWIMGTLMKFFGETDLVARSYFMICSAVSYLLVFKLGTFIKDKAFGYCAVVTLALCFFYGKWNGAIKHDIPLITAYLGFIYFYLRGLIDPKLFYACAGFIAWGVFTKGPVIMGAPLGLAIWIITTREFSGFGQKHFWGAIGLLFALLALPFVPALHFKGQDYYSLYFQKKNSYLKLDDQDREYFFYFISLVKGQVHVFLAFLFSVFLYFKADLIKETKSRQVLLLCLAVMLTVLIAFSFFQMKLAYYTIPAYPFYALFSAQALYYLWVRYQWNWSKFLVTLSVAVMMVMLTFPIKTTGGRPKYNLNMINIIKFDKDIQTKPLGFLGYYEDDMSIFQEYKFYGNLNLEPLEDEEDIADFLFEGEGYFIVPMRKMPFVTPNKTYEVSDCFIVNYYHCMISLEGLPQLIPSVKQWPHEVYP